MTDRSARPSRGDRASVMPVCMALGAASAWLVLAVACSASPPPPSPPTIAAAASVVSAIQSGSATANPTQIAVATRFAPTIQVLSATVGPIATSLAQSTVHITGVNITPSDSTVVVQNSGSSAVSLQGWTMFFGPNIPITLPPIMLAAGQTRTIHVAAGTTTDSDVFLGVPSVGAIATTMTPGQRVVLVDTNDQVVAFFQTS